MWTIAIANQKGGTAKTTTTAALGVLLSRAGIDVHLVDMDPQASLSLAFGKQDDRERLYNSIRQRAELPIEQISTHLTLSPGSIELARLETELLNETSREHFLRTCFHRTALAGRDRCVDRLPAVARHPDHQLPRGGTVRPDTSTARRIRDTRPIPPRMDAPRHSRASQPGHGDIGRRSDELPSPPSYYGQGLE